MKRIVSVSLGSSKRNHSVNLELLGEQVSISRIGTDGSIQQMLEIIKKIDGEVDVIGLGGTDLYLQAGSRRFVVHESLKIKRTIKKSFVSDGTLIKAVWEKRVVLSLVKEGYISNSARVLVTTALDRYGMAEAFSSSGCQVVFGDFLFALNLPIPMRSLSTVNLVATILLPVLSRLPIKMLYPVGKKQEEHKPRFVEYFNWAQVIAGDFHQIQRYSPENLQGKIILTNTTTNDDVEMFKKRGVNLLITTTPLWDGRSFGTNILEGIMAAFLEKSPENITVKEVDDFINSISLAPRIEILN